VMSLSARSVRSTCLCIYTNECTYCTYTSPFCHFMNKYVCLYIYVCTHAGICIHTHIDIYVEHTNMCVCSCACACVCVHVCVCQK